MQSRGFPVALAIKNLSANARHIRDMGSIPGLGRFPGEGNGNALHYSCLENLMDRGAWRSTICWVAKIGHDCSDLACTVQSKLSATDSLYLQPLPSTSITASAPPQIVRSSILIRSAQPRSLTCTVHSRVHAPVRIQGHH